MAKKLPLTKRLQIALTQTNSETEKAIIYGLLYRTAKKALSQEKELFYGQIGSQSLSLNSNKKTDSNYEISKGRELADILQKSINLPNSGNPGYRKKMIGAMGIEYSVIKEYLENE